MSVGIFQIVVPLCCFHIFLRLTMRITNFFIASLAAAVLAMAVSPSPAFAAKPDAAPVRLTKAERSAFLAELQPLQDRLTALRKAPNMSPDRWADAQIFLKGVVWALDFGPVADARSRGLVKFGLKRARERIDALAAGRQPWTERFGRSVRGFISAVDGSAQPYCVIVPKEYDPTKPMRLHVVLHGSTPATGIGELLFLEAADGGDTGAPAVPANPYIELSPMGRLGENSYRFEGETDVDEAIEAVCRDYNIDRSRIVLRGHSLGGVGTWQLGLKRPDRYVAIGPADSVAREGVAPRRRHRLHGERRNGTGHCRDGRQRPLLLVALAHREGICKGGHPV
jgi:hypothetical protein